MNARILLVEGTCGTGKSTLIKGLLRKYVLEHDRPATLLSLSQAHTYFPIVRTVPAPPVGKREHRELLRKILRMLDWDTEDLSPRKWFTLFSLIDTLHVTHYFRPGILSWAEMSYVDKSLARLGGKLVFLHAEAETLWDRLKKSGHNPEMVHKYYVNEQQQMEMVAGQSNMAKLFLPAENTVEENVEKAYAFWMREV